MGIKPENFEEILREEVTRSLGLPKEFSLFPTLLRRFALKNNLEFPDNLLPLEDPPATYYPISSVKESSMKTHLISSSAPKQIILSQPPPSSIPDFLKAVEVDVKVYDYLSQEIGSFKGFMKSKFLGDFLLIQFAKPSSQFIHKILKILHSRDSSIVQEPHVIQARIAQRFSISEPQAFLLPHLWRYCFGNLPVLPWEVKISYFGLVPAGAVRTVEQDIITLKPRLSYHDIDEILPWDSWQCKDIVQDETPQGKVVGFDIVENEKLWHLVVLVSHQKTKEILSGFGRGTASEEEAYHSRIQKRISTTLNIPLEVGLCPDNIARYFLHYALSDSCQDFSTAFKTLENILELKPVPIEKFQDVSTQCIILE